ncbi:MAG TPA: TonB-dependent receptor [Longimicrobiales bacterium]
MAAAVCLLIASAGAVEAQGGRRPAANAAAGVVAGAVVDAESRAPVGAASVEVWSTPSPVLVTGAIAGEDGTFRIEGLQPGTYYLRVTMLGYETHRTTQVALAPGALRVDAGRIALSRSPIALEGVDVNVQSAVVIAPDRNAYVARDVAPAATSATEILESVPSVQVDGDGKVSLRGNENVVVQINGRPAPMRGDQLAGYLRQLPANTIERVEVIPNPSARQDPEGMAGIINIVLKQRVDLGRSGGLSLSAATGNRYSGSGNFGYQGGPATLFLGYGFNHDEREITGVNDRTRLDAQSFPLSFTEQDIGGAARNSGHNVSANLDYQLSERDVAFLSVMANRRTFEDGQLSAYSELNAGRELQARYDRTRATESTNWMGDATLGIRRVFEPQRHELSVEMRYNRQDSDELTDLWRRPSGDAALVDLELNRTDALTRQLTAQADYVRTLGESKLETGYKGTVRWLDRDFLVRKDSLGTGAWFTSDLSNALTFDESVHAIYGVLSHGIGAVQLQAGLRAEHAERDFSLVDGESYPYRYSSVFPSGLISYQLTELLQAKLSYSRRIRRPGTGELNPFPSFMDAQNVFIGNPSLDPEYTDAIELGLQRSGERVSLQFSPFFRRTTDIIRVEINTADTLSGREVTSVSFRNLDTSTSWGADLNGQLRLGRLFSGLASFNVFKMVTDGGSTSSLGSDAVNWTARVNGTFNVSPATTLQAMYLYRAPMKIERGRFDSFSTANVSIRQKLRGDQLTATLGVSDPFNTNRFRVNVGDDNIIQLTDRAFNTRSVRVSLQATFGQAPRVRQRTADPQQPSQTGFPPP